MDSSPAAPSGSVLPFFLRNKWKAENGESSSLSKGSSPAAKPSAEQYPQISRAEKTRIMYRVFTARQIEERMERISKDVLVDIQKQIHRGEEAYYEETNNHGNLFRGWDAYVDSKEIGAANTPSVPQGSRRIPADYRWFASSCTSISRPSRPPSVLQQPLSEPASVMSSSIPLPLSSSAVAASNSDPLLDAKSSSFPENTEPSKQGKNDNSSSAVQMEVSPAKESSSAEDDKEARNRAAAPVEKKSSAEGALAEDDPANKTVPETGMKRKKRDNDEGRGAAEIAEPSMKRANTSGEKDTVILEKDDHDDDDDDGPTNSIENDKMDDDDEEQDAESPAKTDPSKDGDEDDQGTPKDVATTTATEKEEDKAKQEEPRKRRSSRNRRSS